VAWSFAKRPEFPRKPFLARCAPSNNPISCHKSVSSRPSPVANTPGRREPGFMTAVSATRRHVRDVFMTCRAGEKRLTTEIKKPPRRCFSWEASCKKLWPGEVSSRRRLVFLFLFCSLFLGCHEVFSSVNFFPCKVDLRSGILPVLPNRAQLVVWAQLLVQDIEAVLQPCQQISDARDQEIRSLLSSTLLARTHPHAARSDRTGNL
jgi:hypothetical protein